jgi:hypothetical protein
MSVPRRRTPREKKDLALKRDSLSTTDHVHIGHKRKKKSTTRANRHAVKQTLKDPEADALPRRKQVDLGPSGDRPSLQSDIERKQESRAALEQTPRKSEEARARRKNRRDGGT